LPAVDVPTSLTSGYEAVQGEKQVLNEEERGRLVHEVC
jgi:hypothetical protein